MASVMKFDFGSMNFAGIPGTEIVLEVTHTNAHPDTPADELVKVIATGQDWPATDYTLTSEAYGRAFNEGEIFRVRAKLTKADGGESEWSAPFTTPPVPYVPPKTPEIDSITWETEG
ncbi:hypothetical protein ABWK57_14045 [Streptomyces sp. NPDC094045]|uniref:hypothetical protein n=1 Tax=unclassified Streptomyces TaxID=2593676 RepID=UPI003395CB0E